MTTKQNIGNNTVEATDLVAKTNVSPEDFSDQSHQERVASEEFKIAGEELVGKVKELIQQGNVRRVIIKNENGHTLIEMPLNVGVIGSAIGAAIAPVIVAVGVIGAMVAHLTLVIERVESEQPTEQPSGDEEKQ